MRVRFGTRLPDPHRMQLAIEVAAPEFEKPTQRRIIRGDVETLPDIALQQIGMIREMIDDLRGGQPAVAELRLGIDHDRSLGLAFADSELEWPRSRRHTTEKCVPTTGYQHMGSAAASTSPDALVLKLGSAALDTWGSEKCLRYTIGVYERR